MGRGLKRRRLTRAFAGHQNQSLSKLATGVDLSEAPHDVNDLATILVKRRLRRLSSAELNQLSANVKDLPEKLFPVTSFFAGAELQQCLGHQPTNVSSLQ